MSNAWDDLYNAAKKVLNPRKVSEFIETAGVAAAVESASGNIYTGVCVDGACTLGICAKKLKSGVTLENILRIGPC